MTPPQPDSASAPPRILGKEMIADGSLWRIKCGPLEYKIETQQQGIHPSKAITWLYFDHSTGRVRVAGRVVPVIGPLHYCIAAIERELLSIRAAIPERVEAGAPGPDSGEGSGR